MRAHAHARDPHCPCLAWALHTPTHTALVHHCLPACMHHQLRPTPPLLTEKWPRPPSFLPPLPLPSALVPYIVCSPSLNSLIDYIASS